MNVVQLGKSTVGLYFKYNLTNVILKNHCYSVKNEFVKSKLVTTERCNIRALVFERYFISII
jgi:hypothetical protein